jgi:O-antigen/teichoic acid export membrane protein
VKPAWLFTDLTVQDQISHENYGIYAATFSLSFLFINFADFGVNVYVTRKLSMEKESIERLFSLALTFKLMACLIYPIVICGIGFIIGYRGDILYYLFILGLVQALFQLVLFFRGFLQSQQIFRLDAIGSVFDKIILLGIVLVLLATGITLTSFIYATLCSAIITVLFLYLTIVRNHGWIKPALRGKEISEMLIRSFPFAMIGLLYAVNDRIDMVMIERLGEGQGKENAGLYAACYRWLDAFMMYLWTVLPIFFAKFAAHSKEPEEQQKIFNLGQIISFIPMLFIGVVVLFYADKFFWMFTHSSQEELVSMTQIMKVLFVGTIIQGTFAIYGTYLNATGHESKVSYMIVFTLLLNVILNWIFIPSYGPIAAAFATLASSSSISLLYLARIMRHAQLKVPVKLLFHLFVIALVFIVVFYLLSLSSLSWYFVSGIAGIVLVLLTYITNAGNIQTLLKGK